MSRITVNKIPDLAVLLMANILSISSNCPIAIDFLGVYLGQERATRTHIHTLLGLRHSFLKSPRTLVANGEPDYTSGDYK